MTTKFVKEGQIEYVALSSKVLVVAITGVVGDWSAYIDAVDGNNHDLEASLVSRCGTKIPYWMAKKLFSSWDNTLIWRN